MTPPQPTDGVRRFFFGSFFFAFLSHTHATSRLTDTHMIPFRGRVYMCVTINTTSSCHPSKPRSTHPSLYRRGVLCVCRSSPLARCGRDNAPHRFDETLSRPGQCPHTNQPRLLQPIIANVRPTPGCVQGLSSQTPAFVLPTYVLAEQGPHGALHRISVRISVSVLFRFYISFFVSVSVYIVSVRQRTLTNADDR